MVTFCLATTSVSKKSLANQSNHYLITNRKQTFEILNTNIGEAYVVSEFSVSLKNAKGLFNPFFWSFVGNKIKLKVCDFRFCVGIFWFAKR